ncbi:PREDICTED: dynamin-related protein 1C [Populus euphratica]|uniref:Dynamin-related protein 1C n=1 Tax=Populus euphratica TaxID=75702 RepID=A0AAJ6U742_POPEU|nr:PREDICTED: dynamin-related protein 1C [Populus euphratica]
MKQIALRRRPSKSLMFLFISGVRFVLKELVRKSIAETEELKRFPTLQSDIAAAANEALEIFPDESRRAVLRLVDVDSSYLTVEFFRKLHPEPEKNTNTSPNQPGPNVDCYNDNHFRKIGTEFSNCFHLLSFFPLS